MQAGDGSEAPGPHHVEEYLDGVDFHSCVFRMKECQITIFPASPLWLTMFPQILIQETRMTRILRIDASPRREGAHSRELANMFISEWLAHEPNAEIMQRDLAGVPVPHIANETIQGYYT